MEASDASPAQPTEIDEIVLAVKEGAPIASGSSAHVEVTSDALVAESLRGKRGGKWRQRWRDRWRESGGKAAGPVAGKG